tara:strand:+ start:2484 stop:3908 length:1425 start_codon:yes stop_codon:yes gene_type:complete
LKIYKYLFILVLMYYFDDLHILDDVGDVIVSQADINGFTDDSDSEDFYLSCKDREDLLETIYDITKDYVDNNILSIKNYDFDTELLNYVTAVINMTYTPISDILLNINIDKIIAEGIDIYFKVNNNPRQYKTTFIGKKYNKNTTKNHLNKLLNIKQPEQKTDAWYKFRHNRFTASNAWKVLDTDSNVNQIIFEKCAPLKIFGSGSSNTAFHHGHKYEPLSILWYEQKYNTKIEEVGCIAHQEHSFIGASPDGINIDYNSDRYGRLLEIKNPVSRKLSGIPKKEYWVQMQLQMEVWGINNVDFLETVFKEYENKKEADEDGTFNKTKDGKLKGVMMQFENFIYEYCPFDYDEKEFDEWSENKIDEYEKKSISWMKNIYWKLDDVSCILVTRNKKWFEAALPYFRSTWEIIEKERISGYDHRKPKRRKTKPKLKNITGYIPEIFIEDKPDTEDENDKKPKQKNNSCIFKIDTEVLN